ncbi:TonB-dependent receptor plug domain-containing protein [Rhodocista pekingensis]|uniref:TonB-dependent receptor plug domain-containing protein n=1 Tax=Rhodocista pekingensis TaxID=201185 RepID=A0ABW2KYA2_9PROT
MQKRPSLFPQTRFPLPFLAAALVLPALPATAAADDASRVEEIVVTATRTPTPIDRIPASVSVIDREEIRRNAWQTLPDALRTLPGAALTRSGGPGGNSSLFLRGTNSDHVLVLLDGLPVNDPAMTAGAFNFGDDLLEGVSRIEVVRGPASTLYGSNAIGGVINMITRAGGPSAATAEVDAAAGTDKTWRGSAGLYGTLDNLDYGVSVQGFTTDGDNATPSRMAGNLGEEDGFDALTATGKAVVRLENGRLEALLRWRRAESDLDNVPQDEPNSTGESDHLAWQLAGERLFFAGALNSRLSVGQSRYDRTYRNDPDSVSADYSRDTYDSVRTQADWQNNLTLPATAAMKDGVLGFGASFVRDEADFDTRSVSAYGPYTSAVDADADSLALYVHAQARLFDAVDVTAGLRNEHPDDFGTTTTWRLGAVVPLPSLATRLKAAAGSAFKAPTLYDRFGTNNYGYRGNPDLDPEKSVGWEAGFETDLPGAGRSNLVTVSVTWFQSDIDDLITYRYNPDFTSTVVNVNEAHTKGVETILTLRPADWAELTASWTWTDARNEQTDARLLRRPEHALAFTAALEPVAGLTVAPEVSFIGRRRDYIYPDASGYGGEGTAGGYVLANLSLTWQARDDLQLYARGTNLFDRTIEDPNGFAQPDRGILVGVRATY